MYIAIMYDYIYIIATTQGKKSAKFWHGKSYCIMVVINYIYLGLKSNLHVRIYMYLATYMVTYIHHHQET